MKPRREYVMTFQEHRALRDSPVFVSGRVETANGNTLRTFPAVPRAKLGDLLRRGAEYVAALGGRLVCHVDMLKRQGIAQEDGSGVMVWGRKLAVDADGTVDVVAAVRG